MRVITNAETIAQLDAIGAVADFGRKAGDTRYTELEEVRELRRRLAELDSKLQQVERRILERKTGDRFQLGARVRVVAPKRAEHSEYWRGKEGKLRSFRGDDRLCMVAIDESHSLTEFMLAELEVID